MDTFCFYRQGTKQPRNIYWVTPENPEGKYIGVFFDEADAALVVANLNTSWREHWQRVVSND